MNVNAIEAVWVALNFTTLILTIASLLNAWGDRAAVKLLNGRAREFAINGIVRRESFRVLVQGLLLAAVLPDLIHAGESVLDPPVVALMAVPVVLLVASVLDARDRGVMTAMVAADLLIQREAGIARIEAQNDDLAGALHENTRITQQASDHADHAYQEANSVNAKIANQAATIIEQGEAAAVTAETIGHTAEQVDDIHQATVEGK